MELGLVEPGLLGGEERRLAGLVLQVDPVAAVVDVERRVPGVAHLSEEAEIPRSIDICGAETPNSTGLAKKNVLIKMDF